MLTEGSYPFYGGGVAVWCDRLIRDLPQVRFTVLSLVGTPEVAVQYEIPDNVDDVICLPLWGVREVLESRERLSLRTIRARRSRTSEAAVRDGFVPSLRRFLEALFADEPDLDGFGRSIQLMYRFFAERDFDRAVRSRAAWQCFADTASAGFRDAATSCAYPEAQFSLADLTEGMAWLTRWLMPIAFPLPAAGVVHAVSAGLCSIPAVAAKLETGTPFLLTEHGVYLRERYLLDGNESKSFFMKLLVLRFARRITELSYALADQVSPGSNYNQRWERRCGALPARLKTIYNGVDPSSFIPAPRPEGEPTTIAWVGRITPIKDLLTLIRAAAMVCAARPDVRFRLYGSVPKGDEPYFEKCCELRSELGVEDAVQFSGYAPSAAVAFNEADIVVLSSISEGFPYSVVEAMLSGRPMVATAVGGVPEAIEGCGIAVEPRNPAALADAILELVDDRERRVRLGAAARVKAESKFNLAQCSRAYDESYRALADAHRQGTDLDARRHAAPAHGRTARVPVSAIGFAARAEGAPR